MSSDDPKLTAKQQKAQRRAAAVAAKTSNATQAPVATPAQNTKKGVVKQEAKIKDAKPESKVPPVQVYSIPLLSHLDKRRPVTSENVPRDVHPAIIALALRYSTGTSIGSNARCRDMLSTLKKVISDYIVPSHLQTSLQRHLPTYLSTQITFLVSARPLSVGMGAAIRLLKQEISTLTISCSDETNKQTLLDFIDTFIRERIDMADQVIVASCQRRIENNDNILIFAHSSIVLDILITASRTKRFTVTIVDCRPSFEGRNSMSELLKAGIECKYAMITSLNYLMPKSTKVLIGAHAVLANGAVYARAGTAMVSMSAHAHRVPVILACETYKFTDRVQLDAFVTNELGRTDDLISETMKREEEREMVTLNLMYDVTPEKFITMCVSELGSLPTTAIPFAALSEQTH